MITDTLTGRTRLRWHKPFFGKAVPVLQVEVLREVRNHCCTEPYFDAVPDSDTIYWRDVKIEDLSVPGLEP